MLKNGCLSIIKIKIIKTHFIDDEIFKLIDTHTIC